jgi:hypothetical protein
MHNAYNYNWDELKEKAEKGGPHPYAQADPINEETTDDGFVVVDKHHYDNNYIVDDGYSSRYATPAPPKRPLSGWYSFLVVFQQADSLQ